MPRSRDHTSLHSHTADVTAATSLIGYVAQPRRRNDQMKDFCRSACFRNWPHPAATGDGRDGGLFWNIRRRVDTACAKAATVLMWAKIGHASGIEPSSFLAVTTIGVGDSFPQNLSSATVRMPGSC
jgi:hypothetical protein